MLPRANLSGLNNWGINNSESSSFVRLGSDGAKLSGQLICKTPPEIKLLSVPTDTQRTLTQRCFKAEPASKTLKQRRVNVSCLTRGNYAHSNRLQKTTPQRLVEAAISTNLSSRAPIWYYISSSGWTLLASNQQIGLKFVVGRSKYTSSCVEETKSLLLTGTYNSRKSTLKLSNLRGHRLRPRRVIFSWRYREYYVITWAR